MMSTVAQAKRWLLLKRLVRLLLVAAFLALVPFLPRIGAVLDALSDHSTELADKATIPFAHGAPQ